MNIIAIHKAIVDLPQKYIFLQINIPYHLFANCLSDNFDIAVVISMIFLEITFFIAFSLTVFLQIVFTSSCMIHFDFANFQTVSLFLFLQLNNFSHIIMRDQCFCKLSLRSSIFCRLIFCIRIFVYKWYLTLRFAFAKRHT